MCPFRKAFPLVLLLHLLLAVGIFSSYAEHTNMRTFTLLPAIGVGQGASEGLVCDEDEEARPQEDHDANDPMDMIPPYDDEDDRESASAAIPATPSPKMAVAAPVGGIAGAPCQGPSAAGAAISISQTGDKIVPPIVLKRQKPTWSGGLHGRVTLAFTVNKQGRVESAKVESATSSAMSKAALSVLPKWRFTPARENGQSVELKVRQVVEF